MANHTAVRVLAADVVVNALCDLMVSWIFKNPAVLLTMAILALVIYALNLILG